ncbi:MAG: YbaB/EbfC family nucleoid-associated protein [Metamycoplasmataceae bacterium]|uniref:YbaB/EbfC family nucleoid-associated protein n=1 Tax=Mycoplasmopsis lipophila TaxID=2117 RepID=UPI003873001B
MNPEMMKKLKKMQAELMEKQEAFAQKEFIVEKQGLTITALGSKKIKSIDIDEVLIDPDDKELLQDVLVIALNELYEKIDKEQEEMMPQMPGGLGF